MPWEKIRPSKQAPPRDSKGGDVYSILTEPIFGQPFLGPNMLPSNGTTSGRVESGANEGKGHWTKAIRFWKDEEASEPGPHISGETTPRTARSSLSLWQ